MDSVKTFDWMMKVVRETDNPKLTLEYSYYDLHVARDGKKTSEFVQTIRILRHVQCCTLHVPHLSIC